MKFRKKPTEIDAMQLTRQNREAVIQFVGKENVKTKPWDPINLYIVKNNSEDHLLMPGMYVIKGAHGTFEVVEPPIFEAIYELPREGEGQERGLKK